MRISTVATWPDPLGGPESPANQLGTFERPLRGAPDLPLVPEPTAALSRSEQMPWDVHVAGFENALAAARTWASKPLSSAIAVLAAEDGRFALFGMGVNSYNHEIDGPIFEAVYAGAAFNKRHPALQAVVGTTHWIDLRNAVRGTRTPLDEIAPKAP